MQSSVVKTTAPTYQRESPEVRAHRVAAEAQLAEKMPVITGSYNERIDQIREGIFGDFEEIDGSSINSLREIDVRGGDFIYPPHETVKPLHQELVRLVDEQYKLIQNYYKANPKLTNSEKKQIAERFAGMVYLTGVVLHPFPDGNGQTYRLLGATYLQELSPEYSNKYLRQKDRRDEKTKVGRGYAFVHKVHGTIEHQARGKVIDKPFFRAIAEIQEFESRNRPRLPDGTETPTPEEDKFMSDTIHFLGTFGYEVPYSAVSTPENMRSTFKMVMGRVQEEIDEFYAENLTQTEADALKRISDLRRHPLLGSRNSEQFLYNFIDDISTDDMHQYLITGQFPQDSSFNRSLNEIITTIGSNLGENMTSKIKYDALSLGLAYDYILKATTKNKRPTIKEKLSAIGMLIQIGMKKRKVKN